MYLGTTGYVTAKADAFNFNGSKRVISYSAVTNSQGIATFTFDATPAFANVPAVIVTSVVPNVLAGGTRASEVASTRTKIKAEQMNLLGTLVSALVGAPITILVIEQ